MLVCRPGRRFPLRGDGQGAVAGVGAPQSAAGDDPGAPGTIEDQSRRARPDLAVVGGVGHGRRIAGFDPADDRVDDAGAGGGGAVAKHLVEGAAGNVKAGIR